MAEEVAEEIAKALSVTTTVVTLSECELAYSIAKQNSRLDEFDQDDTDSFDGWISGYSNENVLAAVKDAGKV